MKKKLVTAGMVVGLGLATFAGSASADGHMQGPKSTGPGDCDYGLVHANLARQGITGGDGHIPGKMHRGASGFCAG